MDYFRLQMKRFTGNWWRTGNTWIRWKTWRNRLSGASSMSASHLIFVCCVKSKTLIRIMSYCSDWEHRYCSDIRKDLSRISSIHFACVMVVPNQAVTHVPYRNPRGCQWKYNLKLAPVAGWKINLLIKLPRTCRPISDGLLLVSPLPLDC